ncbi:MAG: hypothetical protein WAU88_00850 [Candidatus Zixiibacteriota bacterium]
MSRLSKIQRYGFVALALVIVAVGAFVWQSDLTSDPPMYFSGFAQSLHTDPALYTYHARNHELFGKFDLFGDSKWIMFQYSVVSGFATLWFSIVGVSFETANLIGIFLSLGALLFFMLALCRHHRPWVLAMLALCYVVNVSLLTHGRLPYLENGLLLLLGIAFWVYSWWGDRLTGLVISGAMLAVAMLCGKMLGVLMLPALLGAVYFAQTDKRWVRLGATCAGFVAAALLLFAIFYSGRIDAVSAFLTEKSVGLYGFPPGLTSPKAFLEHLVSYGFSNHLFYLSPDLVGLMLIGGYFLARYLSSAKSNKRSLSRPAMLSLLTVVAFVLGLMPLAYSPLRYALPLIPFIITFCFCVVDSSMAVKSKAPVAWTWPSKVILGSVIWIFLFQCVANAAYTNTPQEVWQRVTWYVLPLAGLLALVIPAISRKIPFSWEKPLYLGLILMISATSMVVNGFRIHRYHYAEHNTNTIEANHDLPLILGRNAVVSGPYGPALTVESPLRSHIYFSGVQTIDTGLFDRQPITHIATDESSWAQITEIYPFLKGLHPEADYWICDNHVSVYRISQYFHNPLANAYRPTLYEQAIDFFNAGQTDSALAAMEQFRKSTDHSKMGELLYVQLLAMTHQPRKAFVMFEQLAARYPTDWYLRLSCGHFAEQIALAAQDQSLLTLAESYFKKAVELNPFEANYARSRWIETMRTARK